MSRPNSRAIRSLTPSIFDQALLRLEGRTCGVRKRKLARQSLQEHLECQSQSQRVPPPLLFLAQGLTESWTQWRAELLTREKSRTKATKPRVTGAGGIANAYHKSLWFTSRPLNVGICQRNESPAFFSFPRFSSLQNSQPQGTKKYAAEVSLLCYHSVPEPNSTHWKTIQADTWPRDLAATVQLW